MPMYFARAPRSRSRMSSHPPRGHIIDMAVDSYATDMLQPPIDTVYDTLTRWVVKEQPDHCDTMDIQDENGENTFRVHNSHCRVYAAKFHGVRYGQSQSELDSNSVSMVLFQHRETNREDLPEIDHPRTHVLHHAWRSQERGGICPTGESHPEDNSL